MVDNKIEEISPNAEEKMLHVVTDPMDVDETTTVNLRERGIETLYNVIAQVHTTLGSVIVNESGTTEVQDGVLTYTAASGNDGKERSLIVLGQ